MVTRILLVVCLLASAISRTIRSYPVCYYGERGSLMATCENATPSYFRVTSYRFDDLDETVRCVNCNLEFISSNTFDLSGNRILNLNLQNSNITTLATASFVGLVYMETLNLGHNNIKTVIPGTFTGIKKLDYLNIGYNKITVLVRDAFAELGNLTVLYLNDNEIVIVSSGAFNGLLAVRELYLQNNHIQHFTNGCVGLNSLKILNLQNNEIVLLKPEDINSTTLLDLNLSGNKMRSLETGSILAAQLLKFNVSNNEIESIKPGAFKGAKALEELDLEANKIAKLDENTFLRLYHLRNINLARNNLTIFQTFVFLHVPELRYLNLANNQIERIQHKGFRPLQNLHSLDLSNNNLTIIGLLLIHHAPRLVFINLDGNIFPCYLVHEMMKYFKDDSIEFSANDKYGNLNKTCNATAKKPDILEDDYGNKYENSEELETDTYDQSSSNVYVIYSLIFMLIGSILVLFFLQYKTYMQLKYGHQGDIAEVGLMSSRSLESREEY